MHINRNIVLIITLYCIHSSLYPIFYGSPDMIRQAVDTGDHTTTERCLRCKVPITTTFPDGAHQGDTLVARAIRGAHGNVVQTLLDYDFTSCFEWIDAHGATTTALKFAVAHGRRHMATAILDHLDLEYARPLHNPPACADNSAREKLLCLGIDLYDETVWHWLNALEEETRTTTIDELCFGTTPLRIDFWPHRLRILEWLDRSLQVYVSRDEALSSVQPDEFDVALMSGDTRTIRRLVHRNRDLLNRCDPHWHMTPIQAALSHDNERMSTLNTLLKLGARIDLAIPGGTPYDYASLLRRKRGRRVHVYHFHLETLGLFLRGDINDVEDCDLVPFLSNRNSQGATPLIIVAGWEPLSTTEISATIPHCAPYIRVSDLKILLIGSTERILRRISVLPPAVQAELVNQTDRHGLSALDYARRGNDSRLQALLRQHGAR